MTLGKARPKLSMSWSSRRMRLGVAHHGAPSGWLAPAKDSAPVATVDRGAQRGKKRR
jgi:hypothetical protein